MIMPSSRVQCEITPMTPPTGQNIPDTLPRRGQVTEACKEWLVREDGALAYKLQQQEVERHYNSNKTKNAIVREDFPMAVDAQREAEKEAITEYQRQAMLLEERDALIARDIALQLEREELERRKRLEEQDKRMAKFIQEKEERTRVRTVADINRVGLPLPPELIEQPFPVVEQRKAERVNCIEEQLRQMRITEVAQSTSDDCSSVSPSWPPPPDMDQIIKAQQEKADEELAKRLQDEEEERTKTLGLIDRDRLLAIEVQDMELAKMMQAKEKAKAKRAREKARAKKLQEVPNEEQQPVMSDDLVSTNVQETAASGGYHPPQVLLPNIAMAIDPTYNPSKLQQRHPITSIPHNGSVIAVTQHSPQHSLQRHPVALDEFLEDDIPPYMPVQGQRRSSYNSAEKKKKKDRSREDCKQQ